MVGQPRSADAPHEPCGAERIAGPECACYSASVRIFTVAVASLLLVACSKSPSTPPASSPQGGERPELTAQACEDQGGQVVGDIGDGAIHRPDYRCPQSGQLPVGSIVAEPGGPMAVEGAVCCK